MQDHGTGSSSTGVDLEATEQAIVQMLMAADSRGVWWRAEVEREIGDVHAVADALGNLHRSGLVHIQGEMVVLARAAQRTSELLI